MVSALEALEAEGRVLVVFDDRGKVMVVSEAEAEAVARVVEKEGRISLAKLTAMCDSMIDLKGEWCVCCQVFAMRCVPPLFTQFPTNSTIRYEYEESPSGVVPDRLRCV